MSQFGFGAGILGSRNIQTFLENSLGFRDFMYVYMYMYFCVVCIGLSCPVRIACSYTHSYIPIYIRALWRMYSNPYPVIAPATHTPCTPNTSPCGWYTIWAERERAQTEFKQFPKWHVIFGSVVCGLFFSRVRCLCRCLLLAACSWLVAFYWLLAVLASNADK